MKYAISLLDHYKQNHSLTIVDAVDEYNAIQLALTEVVPADDDYWEVRRGCVLSGEYKKTKEYAIKLLNDCDMDLLIVEI